MSHNNDITHRSGTLSINGQSTLNVSLLFSEGDEGIFTVGVSTDSVALLPAPTTFQLLGAGILAWFVVVRLGKVPA